MWALYLFLFKIFSFTYKEIFAGTVIFQHQRAWVFITDKIPFPDWKTMITV